MGSRAGGSTFAVVISLLIALIQTPLCKAQLLNGESCPTLEAQSNIPSQNVATSPYFLQTSTQLYSAGTTITLTVNATPAGRNFREILCQARRANGNFIPVGTFTHANDVLIDVNPQYELYPCAGSTVGTSDISSKITPISFQYIAPSPALGNIQFSCTIVQSDDVFYERVLSEQIVDQTSSIAEGFAQCAPSVALNQTTPGEYIATFDDVACPAGQTGSCDIQSGVVQFGNIPDPLDICCRCTTGTTVVSTCCVPRFFDPQVDSSIFVFSENFPGQYLAGRTMNVAVSSPVNMQTTLLFFDVPPGEILRIGRGNVIGQDVQESYQNVQFPAEDRVTVVIGTTLWISFESNAQTIPQGSGYLVRIDAAPQGRKRRSITVTAKEGDWFYRDRADVQSND